MKTTVARITKTTVSANANISSRITNGQSITHTIAKISMPIAASFTDSELLFSMFVLLCISKHRVKTLLMHD